MKKLELTEKQRAVLTRIQNSIPEELLKKVTYKERPADVIYEIIDKAMEDPEVSQEVKDKFYLIKLSGILEREIEVEDKDVTSEIDKFVDSEIEKAIKRGELPKPKKK